MSQVDKQQEIIDRTVEILRRYDSVSAIALAGSHAKGTNTAFSDIDLVVVFKTDARQGLQDIFREVTSIRPTISTLYQLYDLESLILFDNGVRLDLSLVKPSSFADWVIHSSNTKVVYDPDQIVEKQLSASVGKSERANPPKWNESEGSYVTWYFWMFRQAYCYALQSKTAENKSFDKMYSAHSSINSIRKALLDVVYYTNGEKDYLRSIDAELAEKLASTYTSFDLDETKKAIRLLLEIYSAVIEKYCKKEQLEYPRESMEKTRSLFDEFDAEFETVVPKPRRVGKDEWQKLWVAKIDGWTLSVTGDQHVLGSLILFPPKEIEGSMSSMTAHELAQFKQIGKLTEQLLKAAFNPDWFNYSQAGNVVKRLHIHLVPRYSQPKEFERYLFTDEGWGHPMKFRKADELPDKDIVFKIVKFLRDKIETLPKEDMTIEVFDT